MSAELHPCRQPEVLRLLASEDERATEALMERVLEEIPLYRSLDPGQLADVRETVHAGFLTTLELWAAGRLADPKELRQFRANGATRAAEGRPLPLVLRAYRVTGLGVYDYVVNHPAIELAPDEERNLSRVTMLVVDQMSNEVTIGYVETTGQLASQQGRARREFLEDLLAGRLLAAAEIAERATTLGLAIPRHPALIVAAPGTGQGSSLVDRARLALQSLSRGVGEPAGWQLITRGQLVLIEDSTDFQAIRRALDGAGLTGVVLDVANLTELAAAYQRARQIIELTRTAMVPKDMTVGNDEGLLLALLARVRGDAAPERAAGAILGDLRSSGNTALLQTLDAYLLTGNAVSASHRLGVHAQTMRYRLKRIREITGRDPAQGWDRFVLEFALRISDRPPELSLRRRPGAHLICRRCRR